MQWPLSEFHYLDCNDLLPIDLYILHTVSKIEVAS